ncbi:MAG: HAMP domain-containing sensor histidine kinase [Nanoarchaeota archaeon]
MTKNTNKELSERIEQLSKKNEQLTRSLSLYLGVNHDLKIGLATIGGFARNLSNKEDDPNKKQILSIIFNEAYRHETLLRDLKKLYEIESGAEKFSVEYDTPLFTCVEEIVEKYSRIVGDEFYFENQTNPTFRVGINDGLVKSIFDNLIGNTIKFNGGVKDIQKPIEIAIGSRDLGEFIQCHYWENGVGIEESKRDKIFDLHFRGNSEIPGSGIGMHYVKRIIELSGGNISLKSGTDQSTPDGHFTEFIFTLPKSQL